MTHIGSENLEQVTSRLPSNPRCWASVLWFLCKVLLGPNFMPGINHYLKMTPNSQPTAWRWLGHGTFSIKSNRNLSHIHTHLLNMKMLEGCALWINFQWIIDQIIWFPPNLLSYKFIETESFLSYYNGGGCPPIPTPVPPRLRMHSSLGISSHFSLRLTHFLNLRRGTMEA